MESETTQKKKEHSSRMKNKMLDDEEIVLGDNLEQLLWEINEFCGPNNSKQEEIPPALENYLKYVAKTGNTVFPWQHVRPLFRLKMLAAINNFAGEMCINEPFVLERFDLFRAAPFTIQRLAELITQPNRHYNIKEKFLRGLEKTVLVVTTVEPKSMNGEDEEEEALVDEPMSWLSHSDGDGIPDTTDKVVKTESDLNNLNQLIATVHPAPAVEPAVSKPPPENQPTDLEPKEEDDKSSGSDHEEGISDTAMPLNIASPSLDYKIEIVPTGVSSTVDNFTVEPSLEPVNVVQPESNPELVSQLSSSEVPLEHEEPSEPSPKAPELFSADLSAEPQISETSEENTVTTEESPMEQTDFTQDSDTKESSSTDSSGGDSSSASDEIPTLTLTSVPIDSNPENADVPMEAEIETANVDCSEKDVEDSVAVANKPELSEPPEIVNNPTC